MDPTMAEVREVEGENGKFTYLKLPAKPEGVPDKFWNPDNGLNLTALNTGYQKLESGRAQYQEEVRRNVQAEFEGKLPKAPTEYAMPALTIEGAPENFKFNAEADPVVQALKQAGKDGNITQDGFNTLVSARAKAAAEDFRKLGERTVATLGENAGERISKVTAKLNEVLGAEQGAALAAAVSDPAAVLAIEKLVGGGTPGAGGSGFAPELTEEKLRSMMNDPRYYDQRLRDPAYCRQIDEGFKKLYGDQKHDGQPRFTTG